MKNLVLIAILFVSFSTLSFSKSQIESDYPSMVQQMKLNTKFKKLLSAQTREESNNHYIAKFKPEYEKATNALVQKCDKELMEFFMRVNVNLVNSADEELSYGLGRIFLSNPGCIENAYFSLGKKEQKMLFGRIAWGAANAGAAQALKK